MPFIGKVLAAEIDYYVFVEYLLNFRKGAVIQLRGKVKHDFRPARVTALSRRWPHHLLLKCAERPGNAVPRAIMEPISRFAGFYSPFALAGGRQSMEDSRTLCANVIGVTGQHRACVRAATAR